MDPSKRNTADLIKEINRTETALLKRYQALATLSAVPTTTALVTSAPDPTTGDSEQTQRTVADPDQAAVNALRMSTETEGLVRGVRDLVGLNREFKELWLAGGLRTLREGGEEEGEGKAEEDARAVTGLVERM